MLVVEDNKGDVFLILESIRTAAVDAEVHVVHDGEAARRLLDAADQDPNLPVPDLVLLDLNLPRNTGEDVLKHLRRSPRSKDTCVLVVTSSDSARDREKMTNLGIAGYFRKPSRLAEFLKLGPLVKSFLDR